jgi:hypothetical protein
MVMNAASLLLIEDTPDSQAAGYGRTTLTHRRSSKAHPCPGDHARFCCGTRNRKSGPRALPFVGSYLSRGKGNGATVE